MRKLACFFLILALMFPGAIFAGEHTTNNYFYKPSYGEKGPASYSYYNAALDATDVVIKSLVTGLNALTGWAIEDNIVTVIPASASPTYSGADTFTLTGDYTSRFAAGAIVHVHVAAGMVYSTVASSSYAAPTTTVNLNDAVLTDPLTRVYVVATRDGTALNDPGYVLARLFGTTRAALAAADAYAVLAGKELRITYSYAIDDDLTLDAPKVSITPEAVLAISTTKTLTISNASNIGRYQVFNCAGTGKVAFSSHVPVYPEWWGAEANDSTDCAAAIQLAHDSLPATKGGIIDFGTGIYVVTPDTVVISTPGTVLQGRAAATDGAGTVAGTGLKAIAAGTGTMVSFLGAAAGTPLDSCQFNDITLAGNTETVTGLSLKWVSNFRLRNVWVTGCYDHGVYMEQVWDSTFYDLEIESSGNLASSKVGLYIYNGAVDNCNNLRFFGFHAEINEGNDVWIDSSGAGTGGNHNILFSGGKCEKGTGASTKAFYVSGYDGATGAPNQSITIRDMGLFLYSTAGDIAVHFAGDGFLTVDNCHFANNSDGATGIKIEGPVTATAPYTHRLIGNRFANVAQEITIDTATIDRNRVWTDGNTNSLYSETDSRIHINSDLVKDRRGYGVLESVVSTISTSGTGEDNLASTVIPGGLLSTGGGLRISSSGEGAGVAGNKTIKLYFGATAITVFPAGALTGSWQLDATIQNGTAGAQRADWVFRVNGSPAVVSSGTAAPLIDTTVDVTVKMTGECVDAGDTIHQYLWRVVEESQ